MEGKSEQFNRAFELHKSGKLDEAEQIYTEILEQDNNNAEVWNLLGMVNMQKFRLSKACEYIEKAISITPNPYFFENLAKAYLEMEDSDKAIELYTELLKVFPDNYLYLFNLASAYKTGHKIKNAIETYQKAISVNPNNPDAYYNLAHIFDDEGKPEESIQYYEKAVELSPDNKETKYFTSLAYFKNRDYGHGLKYFESRLCRDAAIVTQLTTYPKLTQKAPLWNGVDNISDKTVYTYYEAGFGDVIMFSRYLPLLKSKCKKLVFKPQVPLVELFEYNFPDIEIMRYFSEDAKFDFDYHVPVLSIPYLLGLDETTMFTGKCGYLKANPEITEHYRKKYFNNEKFKIGIKWRGNTHYEMDRVINIKSFTKLFDIPNTQFYSFQTFEGAEDLNEIINDYDIVDIGKTLNNFGDTAGAIENMDLIICNDTSLVHLAGAMTKPCWVLLPYLYNWRWHLDLSKCDWYDSVKLYRQKEIGNWDEIFDRMHEDLKEKLG